MEAAQAFSQRRRLRLGALLLRSGLLSPEQLAEALEEKERTGDRLGEIVVRNGWVSEEAVARTLADQFDVEFVDLVTEPPEARAESLLSGSVASYFRGVPVRFLDAATVLFAVSDPTVFSVDDVRGALGLEVQLAVATDSAIAAILARLEPEAPGDAPATPAEDTPAPGAEAPAHAPELIGEAPPAPEGETPSELAPELVADEAIEPPPGAVAPLPEPAPELEPPAALGPELVPPTRPAPEPGGEHQPSAPEVPPPLEVPAAAQPGFVPAEPAPLLPGPSPELILTPDPSTIPVAEPHPAADMATTELELAKPQQAPEPIVEAQSEPATLPVSPEPAAVPPPADPALAPVVPDEPRLELEPEPIANLSLPTVHAEAAVGAAFDSGSETIPTPPVAPAPEPSTPALKPPAVPEVLASGHQVIEPLPSLRIVAASEPAAPVAAEPPLTEGSSSSSLDRIPLPVLLPGEGAPEETSVVPLFEHRRPQLGTLLMRASLISGNQLAEALEEKEETGERLGEILLRRGWLGEKALAKTLAEQHGLQFYDLAGTPPNAAVATLLPEKYARRYRAIPIRFVGETTLLVAVADPTDVLASDDLRIALSATIELAVATPSEIQTALDRLFPVAPQVAEPVPTVEVETESPAGLRRGETVDVMDASQSAPAVDLVNEVIRRAVQEGASDIHFEPQSERLLVRIRVDGVMQEMRIVPQNLQQAVGARLKVMAELDIAERRAPQDGRITIKFGGKPVDLRVAVMPTSFGEQVVVRILYRGSNLATFEDLGLDAATREAITAAIHEPYGMVVSVGPTGSGKTTTLYAALAMLNTPDRCLMTIEDPVEYQIPGINQIQVNVKAGLSFAQGLRTILRSDPDVLLVGEIRDAETSKIAVQAAMTGHLVLSTLHADNVGSAISRLADMGVERQLLASTINCLFAQRLARRLCASCKEAYTLDPETLLAQGADERLIPDAPVIAYRACGCGQCFAGYKGRVGLFETLMVTPRMRRLFETATAEEIYEAAVAGGMRTLQDDGLRLVLGGITSMDEIRRIAGTRRI